MKQSGIDETYMTNLILVSSEQNRLAHWKQGLGGFVSTAIIFDRFEDLWDDVVRISPEVLLLDFDLLEQKGFVNTSTLTKLCTETKVIVMGGAISENLEWLLLKAGVRGYCQNNIKTQYIEQVVVAVQQGELWIRRTLTSRLVDELGKTTSKNKAYRASCGLLNQLTQREFDVALRVSNGDSNKQIAEACSITERTVKAHLTEIFQKLGVTDRLNLALLMSAGDSNNPTNPESTLHERSPI